ncbi:DUF2092 domain-containing protein [Georgenia satyanarayanai]|uniref:LolA family protein n=1 Tax=Georgenia satyanarayanai TaxID=860221 RepID=UPI00203FD923|nr:DUF2092 domain-containing protein [Georgenia satyanarayanai]MCM3661367.1 DUF2092 domain-containing protein [Georgenia satyanarayanai]
MARSTWKRWLPAGAVVALIAGTVTITSQAGAVDLPDKSPQDVLTLLLEQDVRAYSGAFETSADLGLPVPSAIDLGPGGPGMEDAAGAAAPEGGEDAQEVLSALELLTGDNTGRVFVGEQGARFQHTDGLAERNVVVTAHDVWFYDSEADAATHLVLPEGHEGERPEPTGTLPTPEELAASAVEALEPSTELSVGQHERVAGRDAYTLTLTPRAEETLVGGVTIAVDGETGFPLGVTVTARGQAEPALRAQYTGITFAEPDPGLFDFTAPAGATLEEEVLELPADAGTHAAPDHATGATPPGEVLGKGWGAVVVVPDVEVPEDPMLDELTERVDGGRLLSTALVSVLLTDDGRVLAGAVTPAHLLDLAGR